jgi:Flp pilus assembly protein CpaB
MTYRTRNIAIAVGLALVAMLLTLFYVVNYRRSVQNQQATVQVYVAAHNITAGTAGNDLLHGGALRAESVPRHAVVPGAISAPSQVANLVVSQPMYTGEQVTLRRFADVTAEGIVGEIKGNMRAVQVAGDPNQLLAGTLQSGDHVDLVANLPIGGNTNAHADRIVLRNIDVLSTGGPSPTATASGSTGSVILAVSDTQVQRLFYVLKNSDWTLELRPAVDATDSKERIDTLNSVLTAGVK